MCDMTKEQVWAYVGGMKFAREVIERELKKRTDNPQPIGKDALPTEHIEDFAVPCLARIGDQIARYEPGHDKPANGF